MTLQSSISAHDGLAAAQPASRRRRLPLRLGSPAQIILFLVAVWVVLRPLGYILWGAIRSDSPGAPGAVFTLEPLAKIYGNLVAGGTFTVAVGNSLFLGVVVALLSAAVGILLTWLVDRTDLPGRRYLKLAFLVPLFYSSLIDVMGWSILAAPRSGLVNQIIQSLGGSDSAVNVYTMTGVIFVMVIHFTPYVVLMTTGPMQAMNGVLEEAAEMSGASRWKISRTVTIPLLFPAIAAAGLWVFILAMEMFTIPLVLGSRIRLSTLATEIYQYVRGYRPNLPLAAAAGSLLLLASIATLLLYRRFTQQVDRYVTVSARGFRAQAVSLGRWRWVAFAICISVLVLIMVLPLGAVILRSLMTVRTITIDVANLGFANYGQLWTSSSLLSSVVNSIILSGGGAVVCVLIGAVIANWKVRKPSLAVSASDTVLSLTTALPGILIGIGFLWAYVSSPIYLTLTLLFIALVSRYVGLGIRGIGASVMQTDRALDEAAAVSGANELKILQSITFPLLRPTMMSVGVLLFLTIARELSASVLLYGASSYTLPLLTWEYLTDGVVGAASALAVVQVAWVVVIMLLVRLLLRQDLLTLTRSH